MAVLAWLKKKLLVVVVAHCVLQPGENGVLCGFDGNVQASGKRIFLLRGEMSEDLIDLTTARKVVAYAEAQSCVVLRAEHGGNVLQSVVSGVAAGGLEAYGAEG